MMVLDSAVVDSKRRRSWAIGISLIVVAAAASWVIAHHVSCNGQVVRLWSEKDLPPLPEEQQNGWIPFHSTATTLGKDSPPRELREALVHLEWARVEALAGSIREVSSDPAVHKQVIAAQTALASSRFADACQIDPEVRCRFLQMMQLHDLVVLGLLTDALAGQWDDALARAGKLLRADLELIRSSRSALSALTSQRSVRKDLRLIGVLFDGFANTRPDRLARHGVAASVTFLLDAEVDPGGDVMRAVVAEYVYVIKVVNRMYEVAFKENPDIWWLLLGEDQTILLANPYFEALMQFGESPTTREPPAFPRFSHSHFGWWAYNAGGKLLLDAVLVDLVPAIRDMTKEKTEIAKETNALRQRIRALLAQ